ncbi:hypothetical protein ACIQM0_02545 [Streptomyces sp. NPDC091387]|uniref:hypothetical protein n=1 Tax=Streptomyces sp. NPDC091387 TaxID=3365998 RepID=UPI00381F1853
MGRYTQGTSRINPCATNKASRRQVVGDIIKLVTSLASAIAAVAPLMTKLL